MQKLDENIDKSDLQTLVNELEQKVNIILNVNKEQAATIRRLKKENSDLKKKSATSSTHLVLGKDQVKEIMGYISCIDKCIKLLENQKNRNE
jgi:hypothetical protein